MSTPLLDPTTYQAVTGETISATALSLASGLVRSFCGWSISQETATVTLDSDGGIVLVLPSLQVNSVTSVVLNGIDPSGDPMPTVTAGVDYDWRVNGTLIWISPMTPWPGVSYGWPFGGQRVTVAYDSGYTTVPDEVQAVVMSVAERIGVSSAYQQQLDNIGGISQNRTLSATAGGGSGLTAIEQQSLGQYRIRAVA